MENNNLIKIEKKWIEKGILDKFITFKMEDDFLTATIGDYWFFISDKNGFVYNLFTIDELINMIFNAIENEPILVYNKDGSINNEESTEYYYYYYLLQERYS